jgi:hypothetical protein
MKIEIIDKITAKTLTVSFIDFVEEIVTLYDLDSGKEFNVKFKEIEVDRILEAFIKKQGEEDG